MRKVIGRFSAAGSDGRAYTVEVVRTYSRSPLGGTTDPGVSALFTANAQPVTRIGRGKYRVNETGVTLTSSAPTAP